MKEDKQKRIMEKGIELFCEVGYLNTTVEKITNSLNISKGSFYTYFESKEALLLSILDFMYINYEKILNKLSEDVGSKELEEILEKYINVMFDSILDSKNIISLIQQVFTNDFFKSEKIKSLDLYNQIKGKLCDDYEFAKIVRKYNISIQQSIFPCKLNTEIKDFKTFIKIMRRWHIFVNHYLKDNISIEIIVFSLIPFVSGSLFLLFSIIYNHNYIYLLLIIFTFNSLLGKIIRRKIFGEYENILDMILEIFSNIVQIFYWFLSLIQLDRITWRGKLVKIKNGTIEVNIDEQKNKG